MASAARPAPGARCPDEARQGQAITISAGGTASLAGIVVGQGAKGVVLVHSDLASLCSWLPYGLSLAKLGYRVLAFDLPGHGASEPLDGASGTAVAGIAAAVTWLRGQGAEKVVLIGAAEGATFAAVAAAQITPRVNGLVSISGVRQYGGYDAEPAMRNLLVPALFVAAEQDRNTYLDARTLFDAMPTKGVLHTLFYVPNTTETGVRLLDVQVPADARGGTVHAQVESFLRDAVAQT
ncbi:hypothetical protein GCM10022255_112330 [Dactylosporangium darangshiense]|uniref:AB hydrolase-1 domain-containing protein n=1 Tax=Dactylosporangium darangshiense TaxID=579108 RepID=A0ABP8DV67_9ACTN